MLQSLRKLNERTRKEGSERFAEMKFYTGKICFAIAYSRKIFSSIKCRARHLKFNFAEF